MVLSPCSISCQNSFIYFKKIKYFKLGCCCNTCSKNEVKRPMYSVLVSISCERKRTTLQLIWTTNKSTRNSTFALSTVVLGRRVYEFVVCLFVCFRDTDEWNFSLFYQGWFTVFSPSFFKIFFFSPYFLCFIEWPPNTVRIL